jgi:hypothetical protein
MKTSDFVSLRVSSHDCTPLGRFFRVVARLGHGSLGVNGGAHETLAVPNMLNSIGAID